MTMRKRAWYNSTFINVITFRQSQRQTTPCLLINFVGKKQNHNDHESNHHPHPETSLSKQGWETSEPVAIRKVTSKTSSNHTHRAKEASIECRNETEPQLSSSTTIE
jgi:cytoskeletal protein RodZ